MNVIKSLFCLSTVLVAVLLGLGYCEEEEEYKIVKRPGKNPLKCYKRESTTECIEMEPDEIENEGGPLEDNHDLETGPLGGKLYKIGDEQMECFPNGQCFDLNGELISDDNADDEDTTPTTLAPKHDASPTRIVKRPGKNPLKCFNEGGVSKCIELKPEEVDADGAPLDDPHDVEKGPLGGKIYRFGDSIMECFPNGQCFEVNQNEITSEPAERPDSRFYRRDNEIVDCFATGECNVVDPVTFDEEMNCWVVDANASVDENIESYEDFVSNDEG